MSQDDDQENQVSSAKNGVSDINAGSYSKVPTSPDVIDNEQRQSGNGNNDDIEKVETSTDVIIRKDDEDEEDDVDI